MAVGEVVDLTSFSNFMKVRGLFREQFKQYVVKKFLLENYERKTATVKLGGRTMEIPLETRGVASFGGQLEHEGYAEPDMPGAALGTVSIATLTSSILISLQSALSSKADAAAWASAQMKTMQSAMEMFGMQHSRVLWGDGTGAIARLSAAVTLNTPVAGQHTVTLHDDQATGGGNTFGTKYMIRGLRLSNSTTKTGTTGLGTADLRVIAVDDVNFQIIVDGLVGDLSDDDYLFIGSHDRSSKGRMPVGLYGSVDDGTILGTYLGINRATAGNDYWEAQVATGVAGADLEVEIQRNMDEVYRKHGGMADLLIFSLGVWRRFAADLRVDRQFISAAETGKYKGGTKMLMYTGSDVDAAIVRDRDAPKKTVTGLDWASHKLGTLLETGWLQAFDEKGIFREIPGTLDWCAIIAWMGQPFCVAPGKNFVMRDVDEQ